MTTSAPHSAPIAAIAAVAANGVIGAGNDLPWKIPSDTAYFYRMTTGKTVIMGRKTWDTFKQQPLKNRRSIVLSTNGVSLPEGVLLARSPEEALELAKGDEVMIIGGAEIYALFMPYVDTMYLTRIEREYAGDTRFPEYDETEWREIRRETPEPAPDDEASYYISILKRR